MTRSPEQDTSSFYDPPRSRRLRKRDKHAADIAERFGVDLATARAVARHLALRKHPPRTADLAETLDQLVRGSEAFSWMGSVEGEDPERGRTLDVYLFERDVPGRDTFVADAVEQFDELSLSLTPHLSAFLHVVRTSDCTLDDLRQRLRDFCDNSPTHSLKLDQELCP